MAKYLCMWRMNLAAPTPTDLSEDLRQTEMRFAVMDDLIKKGEIEEFGWFPDGTSGYVIAKGEAADMFRMGGMFLPYVVCEIHEIIPYERGKQIVMALMKAQIEAAKK